MPSPSMMKIGQIKLSAEMRVSRTMRRSVSDVRNRRGRKSLLNIDIVTLP